MKAGPSTLGGPSVGAYCRGNRSGIRKRHGIGPLQAHMAAAPERLRRNDESARHEAHQNQSPRRRQLRLTPRDTCVAIVVTRMRRPRHGRTEFWTHPDVLPGGGVQCVSDDATDNF